MSLFPESAPPKPLGERMRPRSLEDVLGQEKALTLLNAFLQKGEMPSLIFWGPPGSGKTTLSRMMASLLEWESRMLNATSASVKDIRELAQEAKVAWSQYSRRTLVFIDEIHRLNKGQQDVLLPILEAGTFILAGSTTENPYFALTQALRSRVQLIALEALSPQEIETGIDRALDKLNIRMTHEAKIWIANRVGGDMRLAYTVLESASIIALTQNKELDLDEVALCLRQTQIAGDRKGDNHYDLASAYQKSMRGSDANAAIYYLARFLMSGEDPRFIARRLLICAAEDVGNADPRALLMAEATYRAIEKLGMPEAQIPLAQTTLYVARAPKSNEAISALGAAKVYLGSHKLHGIPDHLRDSHYQGAKELGYGKDYIYTHNHPEKGQNFLPEEVLHEVFAADTKARDDQLAPETVQKLLDQLKALQNEKGDWFEIDVPDIAKALAWQEKPLRKALNQLVQQGALHFQRRFKVKNEPS